MILPAGDCYLTGGGLRSYRWGTATLLAVVTILPAGDCDLTGGDCDLTGGGLLSYWRGTAILPAGDCYLTGGGLRSYRRGTAILPAGDCVALTMMSGGEGEGFIGTGFISNPSTTPFSINPPAQHNNICMKTSSHKIT